MVSRYTVACENKKSHKMVYHSLCLGAVLGFHSEQWTPVTALQLPLCLGLEEGWVPKVMENRRLLTTAGTSAQSRGGCTCTVCTCMLMLICVSLLSLPPASPQKCFLRCGQASLDMLLAQPHRAVRTLDSAVSCWAVSNGKTRTQRRVHTARMKTNRRPQRGLLTHANTELGGKKWGMWWLLHIWTTVCCLCICLAEEAQMNYVCLFLIQLAWLSVW